MPTNTTRAEPASRCSNNSDARIAEVLGRVITAEFQTDPLEPSKIQITEIIVTPLNAIHVADVGHEAAIFDDWLSHASDGCVILERLQGVAGTITVAGDSIALIDALNDLVLLTSYQGIDAVVRTALGINLIALLPEPSDSVAARMRGQYFDTEMGLHYNRHCYYDPHCGRYLSKDSIGLMEGMNFHIYVGNLIQIDRVYD